MRVNWQFPGFSFASVTDFMQLQKRYGEDSDISPNPIFNYDTGVHYQQFSQEFRLNGTVGALRWITGAYYIKYKTNNSNRRFCRTTFNYPGIGPFPYGDGLAQLEPHDQLAGRVRSIGIRLERALDRDRRRPLYER